MSPLPTYLLVIVLAATAMDGRSSRSLRGDPAGLPARAAPAGPMAGQKDPPQGRQKQSGRSKKGAAPKEKDRTSLSPRDTTVRIAFRWPVKGRKILEPYGERVNPATGTVTMNPGINIAAPDGSTVVASAAGSVSLVSWLPGYATFVIVEHAGGYRTVYANLGTASVKKGRRVKSGDRLGRSTRGPAGEFVHFEIWRGQMRLDPLTLLPRK